MATPTDMAAATGRVLLAGLFVFSGLGKLAAPAATQAYIAASGLPLPLIAYVIAIAVELGGSALFVLGYQTRVVAAVMALFSVATALGFHHNFADQNTLIHFLKDIAIAGGFLQAAAFGGGACSLDARRAPTAL